MMGWLARLTGCFTAGSVRGDELNNFRKTSILREHTKKKGDASTPKRSPLRLRSLSLLCVAPRGQACSPPRARLRQGGSRRHGTNLSVPVREGPSPSDSGRNGDEVLVQSVDSKSLPQPRGEVIVAESEQVNEEGEDRGNEEEKVAVESSVQVSCSHEEEEDEYCSLWMTHSNSSSIPNRNVDDYSPNGKADSFGSQEYSNEDQAEKTIVLASPRPNTVLNEVDSPLTRISETQTELLSREEPVVPYSCSRVPLLSSAEKQQPSGSLQKVLSFCEGRSGKSPSSTSQCKNVLSSVSVSANSSEKSTASSRRKTRRRSGEWGSSSSLFSNGDGDAAPSSRSSLERALSFCEGFHHNVLKSFEIALPTPRSKPKREEKREDSSECEKLLGVQGSTESPDNGHYLWSTAEVSLGGKAELLMSKRDRDIVAHDKVQEGCSAVSSAARETTPVRGPCQSNEARYDRDAGRRSKQSTDVCTTSFGASACSDLSSFDPRSRGEVSSGGSGDAVMVETVGRSGCQPSVSGSHGRQRSSERATSGSENDNGNVGTAEGYVKLKGGGRNEGWKLTEKVLCGEEEGNKQGLLECSGSDMWGVEMNRGWGSNPENERNSAQGGGAGFTGAGALSAQDANRCEESGRERDSVGGQKVKGNSNDSLAIVRSPSLGKENLRAGIGLGAARTVSMDLHTIPTVNSMARDSFKGGLTADSPGPLVRAQFTFFRSSQGEQEGVFATESQGHFRDGQLPFVQQPDLHSRSRLLANVPRFQKLDDRPIIAGLSIHLPNTEAEWDGRGIPNSTKKYREDQKVVCFSTPFEVRLEQELASQDSPCSSGGEGEGSALRGRYDTTRFLSGGQEPNGDSQLARANGPGGRGPSLRGRGRGKGVLRGPERPGFNRTPRKVIGSTRTSSYGVR
ncbi:hypothetical protein CBR_g19606 [Chara braunii]|uniref:Uncharacterized protein n=1 Tax=Chara braunii TaxID=69332 RepID=A0A388KYS0_CHABU|nr:hypothetical protein CBR_g19606 [Chara braunii]|eukprot:GBG75093.1 hypothetical protein CBR_g19606 [Chara braunii]